MDTWQIKFKEQINAVLVNTKTGKKKLIKGKEDEDEENIKEDPKSPQ